MDHLINCHNQFHKEAKYRRTGTLCDTLEKRFDDFEVNCKKTQQLGVATLQEIELFVINLFSRTDLESDFDAFQEACVYINYVETHFGISDVKSRLVTFWLLQRPQDLMNCPRFFISMSL